MLQCRHDLLYRVVVTPRTQQPVVARVQQTDAFGRISHQRKESILCPYSHGSSHTVPQLFIAYPASEVIYA